MVNIEYMEFPTSAKFVYYVIRQFGEIELSKLINKTKIRRRTVQIAIDLLMENGYVEKRNHPTDGRKKVLYLIRDKEVNL